MYSFSYLEPVCCSMLSSNCCFLACIQVSQEAGQVVWYFHLLKNFPQFIVIHTIKGFDIVNKAEMDVLLELLFWKVVVFPSLFNLSLNLAISSSWSEPQSAPGLIFAYCRELLHSLAAKNIINPISVLTIWWCPWLESFLVLLEEGVCYDKRIVLAKLLAFALLRFVLEGQICLLLQVSLDSLVLHSSPL